MISLFSKKIFFFADEYKSSESRYLRMENILKEKNTEIERLSMEIKEYEKENNLLEIQIEKISQNLKEKEEENNLLGMKIEVIEQTENEKGKEKGFFNSKKKKKNVEKELIDLAFQLEQSNNTINKMREEKKKLEFAVQQISQRYFELENQHQDLLESINNNEDSEEENDDPSNDLFNSLSGTLSPNKHLTDMLSDKEQRENEIRNKLSQINDIGSDYPKTKNISVISNEKKGSSEKKNFYILYFNIFILSKFYLNFFLILLKFFFQREKQQKSIK